MDGINRALKEQVINNAWKRLQSIFDNEAASIFISYQKENEEYASDVAFMKTLKEVEKKKHLVYQQQTFN